MLSKLKSSNAFQLLIDCETTGLNREAKILSLAGFILDDNLNIIEKFNFIINYKKEELFNFGVEFSEFALQQHSKSGLLEKVYSSKTSLSYVKSYLIDLLDKYTLKINDEIKKPIMVNNNVKMDYMWLCYSFGEIFKNMIDYRTIDISSIREMAQRFNPEFVKTIISKKRFEHDAMLDAEDSLMELREYKLKFFS